MNRLAKEKSPYLLQHANNPVDWYPWINEAFEKADRENKPIFLSIGYSTCHWCHVMEKESFEDETVASLMNDTFISIKVDREERPDIDNVYMNVCQLLTGSGGWPLTIVMTPDKKPFFAGTYFPKENNFGRSGMKELIPRIKDIWEKRKDEVLNSADNISSSLNTPSTEPGEELTPEIFDKTFQQFLKRYDSDYGGFNSAPKFATPHNFFFLLRYWKRRSTEEALRMVTKTLTEMRKGGIFDHVGYGFHRYSTDREWLVPHFEKMLYDQALLSIAYTEAYQVTGNNFYKETSKEILDYVIRDMTSDEGAFFSAEDADSEGMEGKFYLWKYEEIKNALNEKADLFCRIFNIKKDGNWRDQVHGKSDSNILYLKKDIEEISGAENIPVSDLKIIIKDCKKILFNLREKRIHPYKDDKILADWNGLMISAFAKASQAFADEKYKNYAEKGANFILEKMVDKKGRLLHRYRNGESAIAGFLDDYAFLISGLLDLYETVFDVKYLKSAIKLNGILIDHFWDDRNGGFYFTANDSEELLIRQKEIYDGAVPSGNSAALLNLLRLSKITGDMSLQNKAGIMAKTFSDKIISAPSAYTQFLSSLDFAFGPSREIVIAGEINSDESKIILNKIRQKFLPNKILLFKKDDELSEVSHFISGYKRVENKTTVYICENYSCKAPVYEISELERLLSAQ